MCPFYSIYNRFCPLPGWTVFVISSLSMHEADKEEPDGKKFETVQEERGQGVRKT